MFLPSSSGWMEGLLPAIYAHFVELRNCRFNLALFAITTCGESPVFSTVMLLLFFNSLILSSFFLLSITLILHDFVCWILDCGGNGAMMVAFLVEQLDLDCSVWFNCLLDIAWGVRNVILVWMACIYWTKRFDFCCHNSRLDVQFTFGQDHPFLYPSASGSIQTFSIIILFVRFIFLITNTISIPLIPP